jgi:tRNA threonylcarbamoyl adenosine modification protein (Sua5/YciO/YrdC/YwlC family)
MAAELIQIHPQNPQANKLSTVVESLKDGGIIVYPTDTVYGIGCDIHNARAVERLCKIQGLDPRKLNLSFICYDLSHIAEYTKNLPTSIFKIMKKTLPGPYTFILNANNHVPKILHTKKNTVGIRVPDHPVPRTMVELLGNPILTASLRASDEIVEYLTDPEEIFELYKHKVDIVIDSGAGSNVPSTVLDCTGQEVIIVREGQGSIEDL